MAWAGGTIGRTELSDTFISIICADGVERQLDVRLECGCHTSPWRPAGHHRGMRWERDFHQCPMHDMQERRREVVKRMVDDVDASWRSAAGRSSGGMSAYGRRLACREAMKALGWGS